ncbi:phospholipase D-like protein [Isoptericola sp. CG 20/1183]|uniref:Phospholipase D-like protein n=1 Tax=Isoptericola halotolerans TaxID=300560 RepID=A0ABX5EHC4_9MICO|nr:MULTISPECIES: PLDc N-terminal domain-containing protein [Isoptericola]PRZ08730.1 phospholipase D-like protein [Isoptericola halotolerans]PRZ10823.1 phospholipase D-like protein [Isoptericola sp. CG 20/1183]
MNPTVPFMPAWYDVAWTVIALGVLAMTLVALHAWWRSPRMVGGTAVGWAIVILALPVVGPALYLAMDTDRRWADDDASSR